MKTVIAIKNFISIEREIIRLNEKKDPKLVKKSQKRICFFTPILMYLETKPKESFIVSERERIRNIIKVKEYQYKDWLNDVCFTNYSTRKLKVLYNRENCIPLLKKQLQTLNFILSPI